MKKIFGIVLLACVLPAVSCLHDGLGGERGGAPVLNVTVDLDRLGSESATRVSVPPEEGEETVNTLYLYFFKATDDRSGKLVDYIKLEGPLSMSRKYRIPTEGTKVSIADAYNIVAVANIDDNRYVSGSVDAWNAQWNDRTEEWFRIHATAEISGASDKWDNSKAVAANWIPMHGTAVKEEMDGDVSLTLMRNVARFDVASNVNTDYDLMSVSIWNGYTRSSMTGDGVMDYSMTPGRHTERFYGVNNTEEDGNFPDMKGRLYAFENKVVSPSVNDRYTTCLIIGLRNRGDGETGYYRVNVHPADSPQNLKRNNVYRITITGVAGAGAVSEDDAYAGGGTELIYDINHWDMDDNGMVVSDPNSILALPVKTVRFGADEGTNYYTITTFSTLHSPSPLMIRSQIFQPSSGKIQVYLNGNELTIHAQRLEPGDEDRTGMVTLTYAGLEATINIIQSHAVDNYLEVTFEDIWSPTLGPVAGLSSGYVYVRSSGPWKAELFGEGFSLSPSAGDAVTVLGSESLSPANDRFHIYTHSVNDGAESRKAFLVISLDSDPANHAAVVTVYQKPTGTIVMAPDTDVITFDGSGAMTSPSGVGDFVISATDDNHIENYSLSGEDPDKFAASMTTGNQSANLTVAAKGINLSGETYTATLTISDNEGHSRQITLRQTSLSLSLSPLSFPTIPVTGDSTDAISLSTGSETSRWTAEMTVSTSAFGKTPVNHRVYFADQEGNEFDASLPQEIGKKFRIVFPKVYFPNREMDIIATVTVRIVDSDLTQTFTVHQERLSPRSVVIWNSRNDSYGALGTHYITNYSKALEALGYGWINLKYAQANIPGTAPSGTNYIHMGNQYMYADFDWSEIEKFLTEKDGILMLTGDEPGSTPLAALNNTGSPLRKYGYKVAAIQGIATKTATLAGNIKDTRIGRFLTVNGVNKFDPANTTTTLYLNIVRSELTEWPDSAVPVIVEPSSPGRVTMAIDPKNKLVFLGECQVFGADHEMNSNYPNSRIFMSNYIEYVINTAKYGSHFTDMLREDLANEIPEMWDDVWGENKWPK